MIYKLFLASLLILKVSGGAFAQEVAPYPYSTNNSIDLEKLQKAEEKFLLRRLKYSPNSGMDMAALASLYASRAQLTGDLSYMDKAEVWARKSAQALPFYNPTPKIVLAKVEESRHRFAEAIKLATDALAEKPGNPAGHLVLTTASLGFGKNQQALENANRLLDLRPNLEAYVLRALVYLRTGNEEAAMADFAKALSLEGPGNLLESAWVRTLIARHYVSKGDPSLGEKYTDSALKVKPNYHVAVALKAALLASRGKVSEASKLYGKAYRLRNEPPYLLAHGRLLTKINKPIQARKLRELAEASVRKEIMTTQYGHWNELAEVLIDKNEDASKGEAIEAAQRDVTQRNTPASHYLLASALKHGGQLEQARTEVQLAIASGEINCHYQELLAEIEALASGAPAPASNSNCIDF